jgi:succinate dehydrogenase / fumarate reductase flavoprotein subunit
MYHQFKQLADIDITKEPMEVGPTTHYVMGGVRVDADTQMSSVPGLFAAGECAAGINGANRLGGNSLSDLLVFGKRAGEFAAKYARSGAGGAVQARQVEAAAQAALEPFERAGREKDLPGQYAAEMMQDLVGIVRTEEEMQRPFGLEVMRAARAVLVSAAIAEYNPGWHAALDLPNLLLVSEAVLVPRSSGVKAAAVTSGRTIPRRTPRSEK